MSIEAAKLIAAVQADVGDMAKIRQAGKDFDEVGKGMTSSSKSASGALNDLVGEFTGINLGSIGVAGAIGLVGKALWDMVDAAAESEAVSVRLDAVLKATAGEAGMTREALDALAQRMMYATGIDGELVQSAEAVLLTFRSIGKDVFPDAMNAAADMAAVMGGDLQSNVLMIGKALQDPINGLTALRRAGVSFTEAQKDVIASLVNTGKTADAQKIILEELNREFGGAAAAQMETYAGKVKLLEAQFGDLQETVGGWLLPTLTDAAAALNTLLGWNERISTAMVEHSNQVAVNSTSYDAYVSEMLRAAAASGQLSEGLGNTYKELMAAGNNMDAELTGLKIFTREQYDAARATAALAAEREKAAKLATEPEITGSGEIEKMKEALRSVKDLKPEEVQKIGDIMPSIAQTVSDGFTAIGKAIETNFIKPADQAGRKLADILTNAKILKEWGENNTITLTVVVDQIGSLPNPGINPSAYGVSGKDERRALGGPVFPGRRYLVGEFGPETFVPTVSGRIEPKAARGGGVTLKNFGTVVIQAASGDLAGDLLGQLRI